jgi:hypothetical protein
MLDQVIGIYVLIDDILKTIGHQEDVRCQMSDSEVLTTLLVSSYFFDGNQAKARSYLESEGHIPRMLSASRFNRRLHRNWELILAVFHLLGDLFKHNNDSARYLVDSFPVAVCHNIRISRSKILKGEQFRGKCVSKRVYFYGFKVFLITTEDGLPVELAFVPGSWAEIRGLEALPVDLPPGSELYGDSGFTNYLFEDLFLEIDQIELNICRKKNSKRGDIYPVSLWKKQQRRYIETVFSVIQGRFPKKIHAVSIQGFMIKLIGFILVHGIDQLFEQLAT